jgi:hypothetical protein
LADPARWRKVLFPGAGRFKKCGRAVLQIPEIRLILKIEVPGNPKDDL